jgi:zinc protease
MITRILRHTRLFFFITAFLCIQMTASTQSQDIPGLYRYTLDNGLQLFVLENNTAPLAFVQIAVRTGAVSQTPQTAGLFHLYEHMMFKGNAKYPDQAAVTAALNKMGVAEWNGSTGVDEINYYVTVPSALVRDGLEFWSYAVRTPLLDAKELENEKGVVLAEITGNNSDPGHIFTAAVARHLFAESPWRLDAGGSPDTVRAATVSQLRMIQQQFYVPENAALFVGGDVHHDDVYRMVCDLYGTWAKGSGPVPSMAPPVQTPFARNEKYVYPNPQMSDNYIQVVYYLRGPDAENAAADTYAADVWTHLLDNPSGTFKQKFLQDRKLSIPDPDYLSGFYSTQRASGMIACTATMLNTSGSPVVQADHFLNVLTTDALPSMAAGARWFQTDDMDVAKKRMQDARTYSLETAAGFLSSLSQLWAIAGDTYFFTYNDRIAAVTADEISAFVKKYVAGKYGMAVVFVSPAVFEQRQQEFRKAGYTEITPENAFWWNTLNTGKIKK